MGNSAVTIDDRKANYSKILSSLFCSGSIIILTILCLLNNLSFDFYSACMLLKVVAPAAFCFWYIGYIMGKILNQHNGAHVKEFELTNDNKAYNIPSMFAGEESSSDDVGADIL